MNEDDPVEVVDDFLDRHADEIALRLLLDNLDWKKAVAESFERKAMGFMPIIIDSTDLIGRPTDDYPGMGAKIKALQKYAQEHNVTIITAKQA